MRKKVENFSNPVLDARTKLGITQAELADSLGISRNYLWLLERGRKPITPAMRAKIQALASGQASPVNLSKDSNQLDRIEIALSEIRSLLAQLLARIPPP